MARTLRRREHGLLLVGVLTAVAMGYGLFRSRPVLGELGATAEQAERDEARAAEVEIPARPSADPHELDRELAGVRQAVQRAWAQAATLESRFAEQGPSGELGRLSLRIAQLAEECGLRVEENVPYRPPAPRGRMDGSSASADGAAESPSVLERLAGESGHGRPLRELVVRCRYPNLRRFVDELGGLPWRVIVVRFEIEVTREAKRPVTAGDLTARLILAL